MGKIPNEINKRPIKVKTTTLKITTAAKRTTDDNIPRASCRVGRCRETGDTPGTCPGWSQSLRTIRPLDTGTITKITTAKSIQRLLLLTAREKLQFGLLQISVTVKQNKFTFGETDELMISL